MAVYKIEVFKDGERILEKISRCSIGNVLDFIKRGKSAQPDTKVMVWRLINMKKEG